MDKVPERSSPMPRKRGASEFCSAEPFTLLPSGRRVKGSAEQNSVVVRLHTIPIKEATILFNYSNARAVVEVIHDEDIPKPCLDIVDLS